jgi:hypothetical protein
MQSSFWDRYGAMIELLLLPALYWVANKVFSAAIKKMNEGSEEHDAAVLRRLADHDRELESVKGLISTHSDRDATSFRAVDSALSNIREQGGRIEERVNSLLRELGHRGDS